MWWLKHIRSELLLENHAWCFFSFVFSFDIFSFKQPTEWSDELLSIFLITLIPPIEIYFYVIINWEEHVYIIIYYLQHTTVSCGLLQPRNLPTLLVLLDCDWSTKPVWVPVITVKWTNINIYPLSLCLTVSNTPTDTRASKHYWKQVIRCRCASCCVGTREAWESCHMQAGRKQLVDRRQEDAGSRDRRTNQRLSVRDPLLCRGSKGAALLIVSVELTYNLIV